MKKFIIFAATLLLARENPFILPEQNLDIIYQDKPKESVIDNNGAELNEVEPKKGYLKDQLLDLSFLQIFEQGNRLSIVTQDRIQKYFLIDRPKKVVFDFKKQRTFATKNIRAKLPFKNITLGAHKTFYRIVIEVDPSCTPKVDKSNLTIECR